MESRFKRQLYTLQKIKRIDGHLQYIENEDGTLFAGPYKTKIKPTDLPEWYIYGRFHKRFGFLSTKGITDLLYLPNKLFDHFLRDDMLLISYGGKIVDGNPNAPLHGKIDYLTGYDEIIWGSEIIDVLRGARQYSDINISRIVNQIKQRQDWLFDAYPEHFMSEHWTCDIDKLLSGPFKKYYLCPKCGGPMEIIHSENRKINGHGFDVLSHCPRCEYEWELVISPRGLIREVHQKFWG